MTTSMHPGCDAPVTRAAGIDHPWRSQLTRALGDYPVRWADETNHPGISLADLVQSTDWIEEELHHQSSAAPDQEMDRKTRATLLLCRISGPLLAALVQLDGLAADCTDLQAHHCYLQPDWMAGAGDKAHLYFRRYYCAINPPQALSEPVPADVLGEHIETLMQPLVEILSQQSGLGQKALWRLVTDGVAAYYLISQDEDAAQQRAMTRAEAVLNRPGSPLNNRQWHYWQFRLPAEESPTGEPVSRYVRIRGGCCRYYTLEGHDYCGTCVLLKKQDREARFINAAKKQLAEGKA